MDGPEEPPKLPPKRRDSNKRVSYLMETEKAPRGPIPLPRTRTRRESMESLKPVKANASSSPLPDKFPETVDSTINKNVQPQENDSSVSSPKQLQSPSPRPRPKPRTIHPSKSSLIPADPPSVKEGADVKLQDSEKFFDFDNLEINESKSSQNIVFPMNDDISKNNELSQEGIASSSVPPHLDIFASFKNDNHNNIFASQNTADNLFTEDPFKNDSGWLPLSTLGNSSPNSEVSSECGDDNNEYMFPDNAFEISTEVASSVSSEYHSTENVFFSANNTMCESNFNEKEHRGATISEDAENGQSAAKEPITPMPFDLKPFTKVIPFDEETTFNELPNQSQPQAALRISELFLFDPLAGGGTDNQPSNALHNETENLSFSVPLPEQRHGHAPAQFSPGAYISLPEMKGMAEHSNNQSFPVSDQKNTSLKYTPSFHFAAPEGPPPPLPKMPTRENRILMPPPVPPRPRRNEVSHPSPRSSPAGSVGASPEVSMRSLPTPNSDQTTVTVTSAYLDSLPTPVFTPIETDPFSGTGFGDVCFDFNNVYPQSESAKATSISRGSAADCAAAIADTPSPAGPAAAYVSDQDFVADFEGAFGGQNIENSPSAFPSECHNPERISRFVIPPPGSVALELSSTDGSEDGDDSESGRPAWTTPPNMLPDITLISSSNLTQKKTTRYGYLFKQGGYNANKGWKKRWVVFNGNALSYYDSNTSQVSKRIVPVLCMKDIATDVKPTERHGFKFKVVTTLKDRVFIFAADTLEDCLTWASSLMAAITDHKRSNGDSDAKGPVEKPSKEGFIKFNAMKRYYVVIRGHMMNYYQSFEDFEMESPIHQIDMKLASVKVKDKRRFKLQLWLHYGHFDLSFESETDMQSWRMAMEDSIAEGLADDTVLEKVYQNLSNQLCADCGDTNPHWASINIGIVLCKNCAGIHRMFDYRVSKVRSLRMDTRVWTPSLIELMVTIGNANSNAFWENKLNADARLLSHDSMDKRKEFISQKYLKKKYCNLHPLTNERPMIGEELVKVASTDNVLDAMQVLFSGADILFKKDDGKTAYEIAKDLGHRLVMELLYQNGGDPQSHQDNVDDENRLREDVRLQGYLNKAGPGGKTFEKRWCVLEHGTLTYYQSEKSPTSKGCIDRKQMLLLQKVSLDRPGHHFEISTDSKDQRTFMFSSESEADTGQWMSTIAKLMSPVSIMEHVGMLDIKFAGSAFFKKALQSDWQQTFLVFIWRGLYYMNKELRLEYIDLRKATNIKLQEPEYGCPLASEKGPCFIIGFTGLSVYVQSQLIKDTEKMFVALESAAKCSGASLYDQVLTSEDVPVIIDKCITHISIEGLQEMGIYRQAAQMSKVDNLLKEFRRDASAGSFSNCTVHEVANALKRFIRELDDSIIGRINYPHWIRSSGLKDDNARLMWYKYYLEKMPTINFSTLKRIIQHLIQVTQYESSNQMTIQNLATCFAPSIMRTLSDESDLSDIPSKEINIIIDLLVNHEYFFQHNDENEIKKAKAIQAAEKKIKERLRSEQEHSADNSMAMASILVAVHMIDPDGQAFNIQVTDDLRVEKVMERFKESNDSSSLTNINSFGLCELIFKGTLVRPLLPDELVNSTIKRWMEWDPWVTSNNSTSLCAREMDILNKLDEHTKACGTHILLSKLHYSDPKSRKFKRTAIGFRQCRLALYNNMKAADESISWPVENLVFYFGVCDKRTAPTKHCLTFLVEGEKCSRAQGIFGHCLSFENEEELFRWASAFFSSQMTTFRQSSC